MQLSIISFSPQKTFPILLLAIPTNGRAEISSSLSFSCMPLASRDPPSLKKEESSQRRKVLPLQTNSASPLIPHPSAFSLLSFLLHPLSFGSQRILVEVG